MLVQFDRFRRRTTRTSVFTYVSEVDVALKCLVVHLRLYGTALKSQNIYPIAFC